MKSRSLYRNTKALSPVIATIILVAVTVAIAIAVAAWLGALTFTYTRTEQIQVTQLTITAGGNTVTFALANSGTSDVTLNLPSSRWQHLRLSNRCHRYRDYMHRRARAQGQQLQSGNNILRSNLRVRNTIRLHTHLHPRQQVPHLWYRIGNPPTTSGFPYSLFPPQLSIHTKKSVHRALPDNDSVFGLMRTQASKSKMVGSLPITDLRS
jgi:flagellin-like protein